MLEQDSQSTNWHHIVKTSTISRITNLGRAVLYFDGKKIGQNRFNGMHIYLALFSDLRDTHHRKTSDEV